MNDKQKLRAYKRKLRRIAGENDLRKQELELCYQTIDNRNSIIDTMTVTIAEQKAQLDAIPPEVLASLPKPANP